MGQARVGIERIRLPKVTTVGGASKLGLIIIRCVVDFTTMIRRHIIGQLLPALADS
jgi:hypothetical protein